MSRGSQSRGRHRRPRRERGLSTLEFAAVLPFALVAMITVVQLVITVHTVQSANDAARQAARAYSLGRDAGQAARDTVSDSIDIVSVSTFGPRHGARVTLEVPRVTQLLPQWEITREAVMP